MALKAVVESLDSVPEGLRGEYEAVEGKGFRLKVEDADSLVDVSGLKSALKAERDRAARAEKWAKLEKSGKTPEEIEELLARGSGDDKQPDTEKLKGKWRKEIEDEFTPHLKERDELKTKLRAVLLDDRVKDAALKAGVFPEDIEDVVTLTRKRFDLDEKDRVVVLDKDGDPSSVTLEKFFAEVFKKEKPKFYKAPESNGSGGRGSPGGTIKDDDLTKLPPEARLTEARRRAAAGRTT